MPITTINKLTGAASVMRTEEEIRDCKIPITKCPPATASGVELNPQTRKQLNSERAEWRHSNPQPQQIPKEHTDD